MDSILQDLRFAVRKLVQSPGMSLLAVAIFALGIGANTATFSMVRHLLLSPLPFEAPERLVEVATLDRDTGERESLSLAEIADVRAEARSLESIGASRQLALAVDAGRGAERANGAVVTPELFDVLGLGPALGRSLTPDDAGPGAPAVALLADGYWRRRFGADPSVVGMRLTIDSRPATVVGVLPPEAASATRGAEVWIPAVADEGARDARSFAAVARLAPNATVEQAESELATIAARLAAAYPETNEGVGIAARRLDEAVTHKARERLLLLQGAVGFVLLIACANVAGLLLARSGARTREIAIRAAIGAGRRRIVRQLLTESFVLAGAGGVAGLAVGAWLLKLLASAAPARAAVTGEVTIDAAVLLFTLAVSVAVGLVAGLAPALRASRVDALDALKRGGTVTSASFGRDRLRGALVVVEIALSLVLLVGAGLLTRAYLRLEEVAPGFDPSHAVAVELAPPESIYAGSEDVARFYRTALERVRAIPGVEAAGAVDIMPLVGWNPGTRFEIDAHADGLRADIQPIAPGYFAAMGIPVLQGRDFERAELDASAPVAVVNERFAGRFWPEGGAVGRRLRLAGDGPRATPGEWRTVVGVVGDVHQFGVQLEARPEIYVPETTRTMTLVARTAGAPDAMAGAIVAAVHEADPALPVATARTLEEVLSDSLAVKRLQAITFGVLGVVAMLMAALGIYGVISFSTARRRREMGIRMALGASPRDVARLVVGQCAALTGIGLAIGGAGALGVSRLLRAYLYGVSALDPLAYVGAGLAVAAVALAAAWLPARAASRVDPTATLKAE